MPWMLLRLLLQNARIGKSVDENIDLANYDLRNINPKDRTSVIYAIEKLELYRDRNGHLRFNPPIPLDEFRAEAKQQLENTLISIKAKNKVVTRNINITKGKNGSLNKKIQLTPRGQLHNETIYGSMQRPVSKEEKVDSKFTIEKIATVTSPKYRDALLARLFQFEGDSKKAFTGKNSLEKNPIYLNELHTEQVPLKVKTITYETIYCFIGFSSWIFTLFKC